MADNLWKYLWRALLVLNAAAVLGAVGLAVAAWLGDLPGVLGLVPSRAVIAYDGPTCPRGWSPFADGRARVLLGASPSHPYRMRAGREEIVLQVSQLPPHSHEVGPYEWGRSIVGNGAPQSRLNVDDGPPLREAGPLVATAVGAGNRWTSCRHTSRCRSASRTDVHRKEAPRERSSGDLAG